MNILLELQRRFRSALADLVQDPAEFLEMIRPTQDPRFGDYQANCAMPLGKRLGQPPRAVAERIVAALDVDDLCLAPEVAGPGFINLRLRDDWLAERVAGAVRDDRLGVAQAGRPRTYVIDYSSPNVAKPMHVGHIRSTVIGDALARVLRFLGHRVITDNHLGDWGTQFGMIIYGYKHFRDQDAFDRDVVAELGRLYKLVHQLVEYLESRDRLPELQRELAEREASITAQRALLDSPDKDLRKKAKKALGKLEKQLGETREKLDSAQRKIQTVELSPALSRLAAEHPTIRQRVLEETAKLHADDPENLALWRMFLPKCREAIQVIYDRLDVRFDHEYGESFYHHQLGQVVSEFRQRGLATESDGAICVFLDQFEAPMIIQKRDGAYLYATTDLATIRYRMETWAPDAILYVVDRRQSDHFAKLFTAAAKWGYDQVELRHVSFGTVMGQDGKPYKTRSGDTVGLESLLDEAVSRAYGVVCGNDDAKPGGAELDETQRRQIADTVGHAAIKYADLSQNRDSDYVFSFDKMVALEGNTATYMQYSYARTRSIFAKGGVDVQRMRDSQTAISLGHPMERALAIQLLGFAQALDDTVPDYRPNQLTSYLFETAKRFSEFYQQCPVLRAEEPSQRDSRLLLCDLTSRIVRKGLELLGIHVVDQM
jgi:arginyl-tRNA synthetase